MGTSIPVNILSLKGQRVNKIEHNQELNQVIIHCSRDRRRSPVDPRSGLKGTVNQYVRRQVRDPPFMGLPCIVDIELAQVRVKDKVRHIESCEFVDKGSRYTKRFCKLVSGMCRHMSVQAVSRHLDLRWETVKNMDKAYLEASLPDLDPRHLKNLKRIGVDEVARAKGHDYMTVIYDMDEGHLIGVETGRTADVLIAFLKQIPKHVAKGIEAIAMDMGRAYQKAARECLPHADIVFDRFHVMQNYSKALGNQRRIEFRKANKEGKDLLKGTHYLVLKNASKLNEEQAQKLQNLLSENTNLNTLYLMKEQLQLLWTLGNVEEMQSALEAWCELADESGLLYLKKFAKSLRSHRVGICNYAKHKLTSARIEAGNISIGMIRKRARGIRDTEYFKLKIRQSSLPDTQSMFYS